MAYLALYRAWRPQLFAEVVGQENTVTALRNAIIENRLSHAYLCSGPRGTGKTSIAKIIAKAVNCENIEAGEPCNKCSSCQDINNGSFLDVIEIDAASNRGIDEIRDLREKVRILPAQGKHKVYIIDEVHMLTTEAFNALLKTLEEPPASVMFILATTEPQKIPATIRSRCQNYNFRRLSPAEILSRLKYVAQSNQISIEDDALQIMARRANGGLRDALSFLDQISSYKGSLIGKKDVEDVLGLVDAVFLAQLFKAVFSQDTIQVIKMLDVALSQGKEAQQMAREASFYLRDLLLYSLLGEAVDFSIISPDNMEYVNKQKKQTNPEKLLKALRIMMDSVEKLRFSEGNKLLLEVTFLEISSLMQVEKGPNQSTGSVKITPTLGKGEANNAQDEIWPRILQGVKEQKIPTHALLSQGKFLGIKEESIYIGYRTGYKFHKERMEEKANRDILEKVITAVYGRQLQINFIFIDEDHYNDIIVKKAIEFFGEDIVEVKE